MRVKALLLDTDFIGEIRNTKVKDGRIRIDNKEFRVDKSRPIILKSGFFAKKPLYILKWDSLIPAEYKLKETVVSPADIEKFTVEIPDEKGMNNFIGKNNGMDSEQIKKKMEEMYDIKKYHLRSLEPLSTEFYKTKITPSVLTETADMRFIKSMKKYIDKRGFEFGNIIFIIMIIGIILFGILMATGSVGLV